MSGSGAASARLPGKPQPSAAGAGVVGRFAPLGDARSPGPTIAPRSQVGKWTFPVAFLGLAAEQVSAPPGPPPDPGNVAAVEPASVDAMVLALFADTTLKQEDRRLHKTELLQVCGT